MDARVWHASPQSSMNSTVSPSNRRSAPNRSAPDPSTRSGRPRSLLGHPEMPEGPKDHRPPFLRARLLSIALPIPRRSQTQSLQFHAMRNPARLRVPAVLPLHPALDFPVSGDCRSPQGKATNLAPPDKAVQDTRCNWTAPLRVDGFRPRFWQGSGRVVARTERSRDILARSATRVCCRPLQCISAGGHSRLRRFRDLPGRSPRPRGS